MTLHEAYDKALPVRREMFWDHLTSAYKWRGNIRAGTRLIPGKDSLTVTELDLAAKCLGVEMEEYT